MKMRSVLTLVITLLSMPALAAMKTVILSLPGMNCAACPITVKMALNKVDGVSQVDVSYPDREAVVSFDDTQTSVAALTQATGNAGYPSTIKPAEAERE